MLSLYLLTFVASGVMQDVANFFDVDDLATGWQLLTLLAIGNVDKMRGNAFLC